MTSTRIKSRLGLRPRIKITSSSIMPAAPSTSGTYLSKTRVRAGLLTPHNSITEDLPVFTSIQDMKASSSAEGKGKAKAVVEEVPEVISDKASLYSVSISGEDEAAKFEAELVSLDNRAIELEKELAAVREAAIEMRSCFIGYWDETMDGSFNEHEKIQRPPTPPAENANKMAGPTSSQSQLKRDVSAKQDYFDPPPRSSVDMPPVLVMDPETYYVWFDLESTTAEGDMKDIHILEIAVKITDKNFQPLDNGLSILVYYHDFPYGALLKEMIPKVLQMHEESGLLSDYRATPEHRRYSLPKADSEISQYLYRRGIREGYGLLAGAGVAFDRAMIRHHLPKIDKLLNYQVFDTTTLWHFVRRKYNRNNRFSTKCVHRAMADIDGAINEARMYGELVFKTPRDVVWPSSNGL